MTAKVDWFEKMYYGLACIIKSVFQHQAVAFMLADMSIGIETARLVMLRAAYDLDQGKRSSYFASIAKAHAADMANKCASDAVQVCSLRKTTSLLDLAKKII